MIGYGRASFPLKSLKECCSRGRGHAVYAGVLTDTLGFLCLTGPVRRPLAGRLVAAGVVRAGGFGSFSRRNGSPRGDDAFGNRAGSQGQVFEGEYIKAGSEPPLEAENTPGVGEESKIKSNKNSSLKTFPSSIQKNQAETGFAVEFCLNNPILPFSN